MSTSDDVADQPQSSSNDVFVTLVILVALLGLATYVLRLWLTPPVVVLRPVIVVFEQSRLGSVYVCSTTATASAPMNMCTVGTYGTTTATSAQPYYGTTR